MENTKALESVEGKIDAIIGNLKAYKAVDATLSEETLKSVANALETANNVLERGFIGDACDDVEEII
jgi:hypothetical protein